MKIPTFTNRGKGMLGGLAGGLMLAALLLTSCGAGNPQLDDLQNLPPSYPNYAATIINVNGFPNVTMLCWQGAGFATTTRDAAGAITLVPEWDQFCKQQIGKQATQNGQP